MIDGGAQDFSAASAAEPDQGPSDSGFEPRIMRLPVVVGEGGRATPGRSYCKCSFAAGDRAGQRHERKGSLGRGWWLCEGERARKQKDGGRRQGNSHRSKGQPT